MSSYMESSSSTTPPTSTSTSTSTALTHPMDQPTAGREQLQGRQVEFDRQTSTHPSSLSSASSTHLPSHPPFGPNDSSGPTSTPSDHSSSSHTNSTSFGNNGNGSIHVNGRADGHAIGDMWNGVLTLALGVSAMIAMRRSRMNEDGGQQAGQRRGEGREEAEVQDEAAPNPDVDPLRTVTPITNSSSNSGSKAGKDADAAFGPPSPSSSSTPYSCRICLSSDVSAETGRLFRPCLCGGSMRVHEQCLMQWRRSNDAAFFRCEICHYRYRTRRASIARWLMHPATSGSITAVMLITAVWMCGHADRLWSRTHVDNGGGNHPGSDNGRGMSMSSSMNGGAVVSSVGRFGWLMWRGAHVLGGFVLVPLCYNVMGSADVRDLIAPLFTGRFHSRIHAAVGAAFALPACALAGCMFYPYVLAAFERVLTKIGDRVLEVAEEEGNEE